MTGYGTDFLLWSYFGLSTEEVYQNDEKKDGHERLVEAAILRAYRDASSHVLSVKEEYKEDLKKDAINIIKKFIQELKTDYEKQIAIKDMQSLYDKGHEEACKDLIAIYSKEEYYRVDKKGCKRKFTYGVAQKWINMSMKYIYMLNNLLGKLPCLGWVEHFVKVFHVPLDSYIFDALKLELELDVDKYLKENKWSKITNYNDYIKLQDAIRDRLNKRDDDLRIPINWENPAWIRVARIRG